MFRSGSEKLFTNLKKVRPSVSYKSRITSSSNLCLSDVRELSLVRPTRLKSRRMQDKEMALRAQRPLRRRQNSVKNLARIVKLKAQLLLLS